MNYQKINIIITGATGFIGTSVIALLANRKYNVVALHRSGKINQIQNNIYWVKCNFEEPDWEKILYYLGGKPKVLIHLAAHGVINGQDDWKECFKCNVSNTLELYQSVIFHGVDRIITCGSCFEYGNASNKYKFIPTYAAPEPLDAYTASKAASTMMLHGMTSSFGIEGIVLRPCVVYGEGENPNRLWPSLRDAATNGYDLQMTSGQQVRDFIPVSVVAEAIVNAVIRKDLLKGTTCIENLSSGNPITVKDFSIEWWNKWAASGNLLFGSLKDRENETLRIVPEVKS